MINVYDVHGANLAPISTAKLFMNGRSQALRLPAEFRFENCDQVYIRRDEQTGDIIISKRPNSWDGFFALADALPAKEVDDCLDHRDNDIEDERDIF